MANYYDQIVVQPIIPDADMTALERILLTNIFECHDDGWYFFAVDVREFVNSNSFSGSATLK